MKLRKSHRGKLGPSIAQKSKFYNPYCANNLRLFTGICGAFRVISSSQGNWLRLSTAADPVSDTNRGRAVKILVFTEKIPLSHLPVVDTKGNLTTVDAFGRQIVAPTGANINVPNDLVFQSNWITASIGTKRYGISPSRVYDFETGRILQRDPLPNALIVAKGAISNAYGIYRNTMFGSTLDSQSAGVLTYGINYYTILFIPNKFDPTGLICCEDDDGTPYERSGDSCYCQNPSDGCGSSPPPPPTPPSPGTPDPDPDPDPVPDPGPGKTPCPPAVYWAAYKECKTAQAEAAGAVVLAVAACGVMVAIPPVIFWTSLACVGSTYVAIFLTLKANDICNNPCLTGGIPTGSG